MCGGAVGNFFEDVTEGISDLGSSVDDFVNEEIPGGWAGAALAAAGVYYAPELSAFVDSSGTVVGATAEEAAATTGVTTTGSSGTGLTVGSGATGVGMTTPEATTGLGATIPSGVPGLAAGSAAGTDLATVAGVGTGVGTLSPLATGTGSLLEGASAVGAGAGAGALTGAEAGVASGVAGGVTGGAAAGSALSTIGSALSIASGLNAITGGAITSALGGGSTPTSAQTQQMADPFSPYRSQLAQMYAGYLTGGNKTDITQMPGYSQFQTGVLDPAIEATKRSAAKSGQMISGNELIALQKQGQTGYSGFMNDYLNRLATASGAGASPYNAAQLATSQTTAQQQAIMQGIGGVATGLAGLYGGTSTGTGTGSTYQPLSTNYSVNANYGYGPDVNN
jgi:hypothetical protein